MRTILISGASGVVGYGILRSLKRSGDDLRLIGTSTHENSAAVGFSDIFELAPNTNHPGYLDWLLTIINKYKVDLLIPGIEIDMHYWSEQYSEIEKSRAKAVLNGRELIALCGDKWEFFKTLKSANSPYAIDTSLESDFDLLCRLFGIPFLLKPRSGFGSKGIVVVDSAATFYVHQSKIGNTLMVQPYIGSDDEEYTVAAFGDGQGRSCCSIAMLRKLSRDGFTEKAEIINNSSIDVAIAVLCELYKPIGPTNFQFRVHKGSVKLLEINPRISSSTSLRAAFGYNEAKMAIDFYLHDTSPTQPSIRRGWAVRYLEDLIFYK